MTHEGRCTATPGHLVTRIAKGLESYRAEMLTMNRCLGYVPNLLIPRSFNEKVVSRKLGRPPTLWSILADKVLVRQHVAERIGRQALNDVYLISDNPDEIRFDRLPPRFVVKPNHGSGWSLLVPDKSQVNEASVRGQCRQWLNMQYGARTHESWYASIPPKIIIERLLEDPKYGTALDYKFWVFHGVAQFVQVDFDRLSHHTRNLYDRAWRRQEWGLRCPAGPELERPARLDEMIECAERLAVDPKFVRVDLYGSNDAVVFGELTFAPGAGWDRFWPAKQNDFFVGSFW